MNIDIQRAALRAAAKLALAAAVPLAAIACGAADGPTTNDGTNAGAAGATEDDMKAGKTTVDAYCKSKHADETTVECCQAEVAHAKFPSEPKLSPDPDIRVDALTRGCCTVLVKDAQTATDEPPDWQDTRTKCCSAVGWKAAVTCTPWGPPVPPAMKKRAQLVA